MAQENFDEVLSEEEQAIVVRRLAMLQSPAGVAHELGYSEQLVERLLDANRAKIEILKKRWKDLAAVEAPLVGELNRLKMLNDMANDTRQSEDPQMLRIALACAKEIREILNEQQEHTTQMGLAIMDELEQGHIEKAESMLDETASDHNPTAASFEAKMASMSGRSTPMKRNAELENLEREVLNENKPSGPPGNYEFEDDDDAT